MTPVSAAPRQGPAHVLAARPGRRQARTTGTSYRYPHSSDTHPHADVVAAKAGRRGESPPGASRAVHRTRGPACWLPSIPAPPRRTRPNAAPERTLRAADFRRRDPTQSAPHRSAGAPAPTLRGRRRTSAVAGERARRHLPLGSSEFRRSFPQVHLQPPDRCGHASRVEPAGVKATDDGGLRHGQSHNARRSVQQQQPRQQRDAETRRDEVERGAEVHAVEVQTMSAPPVGVDG